MRKFFLTKFVCSKCKANLEIEYARDINTDWEKGEPTGGDCVSCNVIVHPCRCTIKESNEIKDAISLLLSKAK